MTTLNLQQPQRQRQGLQQQKEQDPLAAHHHHHHQGANDNNNNNNKNKNEHHHHHHHRHGGEWRSLIDPRTGTPYYCNVRTGKTQWDRPTDTLITPFLSSTAGQQQQQQQHHHHQQRSGINVGVVRNAIINNSVVDELTPSSASSAAITTTTTTATAKASSSSSSSLDTTKKNHLMMMAASTSGVVDTSSNTSCNSKNGGLFLLTSSTSTNTTHINNKSNTTNFNGLPTSMVDGKPRVFHHQPHHHPTFLGSDVLGAEAKERYQLAQPLPVPISSSSSSSCSSNTSPPSSSALEFHHPSMTNSSSSLVAADAAASGSGGCSGALFPGRRRQHPSSPILPSTGSSLSSSSSSVVVAAAEPGIPIASSPRHQQEQLIPGEQPQVITSQPPHSLQQCRERQAQAQPQLSQRQQHDQKQQPPPQQSEQAEHHTTPGTTAHTTTTTTTTSTTTTTTSTPTTTNAVQYDQEVTKPAVTSPVTTTTTTTKTEQEQPTSTTQRPGDSTMEEDNVVVGPEDLSSKNQMENINTTSTTTATGPNTIATKTNTTKVGGGGCSRNIPPSSSSSSSSSSAAAAAAAAAATEERMVWVKFGKSTQLAFLLSVDGNNNATVRWESTKLKEEVSLDRIEEMEPKRCRRVSSSSSSSTSYSYSSPPTAALARATTTSSKGKVLPGRKKPRTTLVETATTTPSHKSRLSSETTTTIITKSRMNVAPASTTTTTTPPSKPQEAVAKITPEEQSQVAIAQATAEGGEDLTAKVVIPEPQVQQTKEVKDDVDGNKKATNQSEVTPLKADATSGICDPPRKGKDIAALLEGKPMESLTTHMDKELVADRIIATDDAAGAGDASVVDIDKKDDVGRGRQEGGNPKEDCILKGDHESGFNQKTIPMVTGEPNDKDKSAVPFTKNFFEADAEDADAVKQDVDGWKGESPSLALGKGKAHDEDDNATEKEEHTNESKPPPPKKRKKATTAVSGATKPKFASPARVIVTLNKEEGSKLGVSLTAVESKIFITKVEEDGLLASTDLKAGMEIYSINDVLVPDTLAGAAEMLMEATGIVTVVAFKGTLMRALQSQDQSRRRPSSARVGKGDGENAPSAEAFSSKKSYAAKKEETKPTDASSEPGGPDLDEGVAKRSSRRSTKVADDEEWQPEKETKAVSRVPPVATRRSRRSSKSLYRIDPAAATLKLNRGRPKKTSSTSTSTNTSSTSSSTKASAKKRKRESNSDGSTKDDEELHALKAKHVGEIERVVTRQQAELERVRQRALKGKHEEFGQYEAEREASLEQWEATLEERETTLEERETSLEQKEACLGKKEATLERKESSLEQKRASLDLKEKDVLEREAELDSYSAGTVEPYEAMACTEEENVATNTSEPSTEVPNDSTVATGKSGERQQHSTKLHASTTILPVTSSVLATAAVSKEAITNTDKEDQNPGRMDVPSMLSPSAAAVQTTSAGIPVHQSHVNPAGQYPQSVSLAFTESPMITSNLLPSVPMAQTGAEAMPQQPAIQATYDQQPVQGFSQSAPSMTSISQRTQPAAPLNSGGVKSPTVKKKKAKMKKALKPAGTGGGGGAATKATPNRKNPMTAMEKKQEFPQPVGPPISHNTKVIPTKMDAVFGRGRKKTHIRTDNLYRDLIETNCHVYSTLDVTNYALRREYVKEKIIDPILDSGGRFIMRMNVNLKLLDVNDKSDLKLIYKKIQRALFNERKRRESRESAAPGTVKAKPGKLGGPAKRTKVVQQSRDEEDEEEEGVSAYALKGGEDALDGAGIEGFENIDMMTEEIDNLGFSFDDEFDQEVSTESFEEDNEREGTAPTEDKVGSSNYAAFAETLMTSQTQNGNHGEGAFDKKGLFEHQTTTDMAMIVATGENRLASLAETTQQQMFEIASVNHLEMENMMTRMF